MQAEPNNHPNLLDARLSREEREAIAGIKVSLDRLLAGREFRMILFGSKARGDYDGNSDIDLAIIVEGLDRALKLGIYDAIGDVELERLLPVSALVVSAEDFRKLRSRERRIAIDIEDEGIPL